MIYINSIILNFHINLRLCLPYRQWFLWTDWRCRSVYHHVWESDEWPASLVEIPANKTVHIDLLIN